MTAETLNQHYSRIVSAIAAMLHAQAEYFAGKNKGYKEPHKLHKCIALEHKARALYKELFVIPAATLPVGDTTKEYLHFMERTRFLLSYQAIYFKTKQNKEQCISLEHEVRKLIKNYKQQTSQLALL